MKCNKTQKYFVTFVPHFDKVGDWKGRRLTARDANTDEFTLKKAEKIVRVLEKRGDKAIKTTKVKMEHC